MMISHILYKVDDLEKGVKLFNDKGFKVEYGSEKNPHNALVYFNDGSYVEILKSMGFTKPLAFILRRIGYREFVDGMLDQEKGPEGYMRIAFESDDTEFVKEKRVLQKLGKKTVCVPISRKDLKGDLLKCKCLFPYDGSFPFIKSRFENFTNRNIKHPNGAVGFGKVEYHTSAEVIDYIGKLGGCSNLDLHEGESRIEVSYVYE